MQLLWIEFGALTLLVSLLAGSWVRRLCRQGWPKRKAARLPPRGFDATSVKQRLEQLRQDPVAVATLRPRRTPSHDLMVAAVRRSLKQFSYFRSAPSDTPDGQNESREESHT